METRKSRRRLPKHVQNVISASSASLHPSCKTLEEVVLLRKFEKAFPSSLSLGGEEEKLVAKRTRRLPSRSVPFKSLPDVPARLREDSREEGVLIVTEQEDEKQRHRDRKAGRVESLRSQLRKVLDRLESLEKEHKLLIQDTKKNTNQHPPDASRALEYIDLCQEREEMVLVMDGIQDTIQRLEKTLNSSEQEAAMRQEATMTAATRINAMSRGFLQRRRFRQFQLCLQRWRARNQFGVIVDQFKSMAKSYREVKYLEKDFQVKLEENRKERMFVAWRNCVIEGRPERQQIIEAAASFRASLERNLVALCFHHWHTESIGPRSRKKVRESHIRRYTAVRDRLKSSNERRPEAQQREISKEKVIEEMNKEAIELMQKKRAWYRKRIFFACWKEEFLFHLNQLKARADHFFYLKKLPLFFRRWKVFYESRLSQAKVTIVYNVDRFDALHNERVIENFARRQVLTKFWRSWKLLVEKNKRIRERYKSILLRRLSGVFHAWKARARFQRQVKSLCVQEWRDMVQRRTETCFRAWFIYTKTAQQKRATQTILLSAFERRKRRLLLSRMFRLWSHKAIYGRIGGMHSRAELLKALEVQKKMVLAMEANAIQQKAAMEEMEDALTKEKDRSASFQVEMAEKVEDNIKLKMAQQQMEAEIIRLQSLLDSFSLIHPGTAKRLVNVEEKAFGESIVSEVARRAGQKAKLMNGADPQAVQDMVCRRCGWDARNTTTTITKPLSARLLRPPPLLLDVQSTTKEADDESAKEKSKLGDLGIDTTMEETVKESENSSRTTSHAFIDPQKLVWVTRGDSDVILRSQFALRKIKFYARKKQEREKHAKASGAAENDMMRQVDEIELENRNLRSLMAFVIFGDKDALHLLEPAKGGIIPPPLCKEDLDRAHAVASLEKASLHSSLNWNDFVQGVAKEFPLLHRLNDDPKKALARRITQAKQNARQNRLRVNKKKVNIYSSAT